MVEGQDYMMRKSKYEMLEMELANKIVYEQARARFPLGVQEHDVSGKVEIEDLSW